MPLGPATTAGTRVKMASALGWLPVVSFPPRGGGQGHGSSYLKDPRGKRTVTASGVYPGPPSTPLPTINTGHVNETSGLQNGEKNYPWIIVKRTIKHDTAPNLKKKPYKHKGYVVVKLLGG